jgi:hypothetical protein
VPSCSFLSPFFCILHLPALFCHACSCRLANGSIISEPMLSLICDRWRRRTFFFPQCLTITPIFHSFHFRRKEIDVAFAAKDRLFTFPQTYFSVLCLGSASCHEKEPEGREVQYVQWDLWYGDCL